MKTLPGAPAISALLIASLCTCPAARGATTYRLDPVNGDDRNPAGGPWETFGKLNSTRRAPGDQVIIAPGLQEETLKPAGAGTEEAPVVIRFRKRPKFVPRCHSGERAITLLPQPRRGVRRRCGRE